MDGSGEPKVSPPSLDPLKGMNQERAALVQLEDSGLLLWCSNPADYFDPLVSNRGSLGLYRSQIESQKMPEMN